MSAERAAADFREHVIGLGKAQLLGNFADCLVGHLDAFVGEHFLENVATELHMLAALRMPEETPDFCARTSSDDELFPERRRRLLFRADDLDLIAVAK